MTGELAAAYRSGSQRARVVPESWGESNLYCPNSDKSRAGCSSPKLSRRQNNTTRLHLVSVGRRPAIIPVRVSAFALASARQGGFWYQLKMGSATVPVAVRNVPLRTASASSVRRDADRRARDACAPHFARELEKLHPDNPVNNIVTRGRPPRP